MKTLIIILFVLIFLKYLTRFINYMNILEIESEENWDILRKRKEEEKLMAELERLDKELDRLKKMESKKNRTDF